MKPARLCRGRFGTSVPSADGSVFFSGLVTAYADRFRVWASRALPPRRRGRWTGRGTRRKPFPEPVEADERVAEFAHVRVRLRARRVEELPGRLIVRSEHDGSEMAMG